MNSFRSLKHMPQLDGLRAIAVAGVLVSHFGLGPQLNWLSSVVPWGHLGVRLFFVLSGFLITRILLERRAAIGIAVQTPSNALLLFYARRALRIFPVFYLTIFLACILNVSNMRDVAFWHSIYMSNLETVLFTHLADGNATLRDATSAHFWSLAVEEQFYLFWPALLLLLDTKFHIKIVFAMICLAPVFRAIWFLYYPDSTSHSLINCLDSLGVGALLTFYSQRSGMQFCWLTNRYRWILLFGVSILGGTIAMHAFDILYRPRLILMDIGESIVFGFVVMRASQGRNDLFGRFLQWTPLNYIGKISYGVYVYHAFMSPLQKWIWRFFDLPDVASTGWRPLVLVGMTICMSILSWHFLEKPINKLKDRLPRGPALSTGTQLLSVR